jgi:putative oxidoreductase
MNRLAPYAAFFMRLAVGGVFLIHGIARVQGGLPPLSMATLVTIVVIAIETVGAVCVLLGIMTRLWATAMAVLMTVTILANRLPQRANFELEALLLAGAVTLMALGDGPLSIAVRFKKSS